jgi:RimJ/RimL family protein N-acetyltransferase
MTAPVLQTERLVLRAPRLEDFERRAEFYASERSRFEGGPLDRVAAYQAWAADVALWLLRGYGAFGVEDRAGGYLGEVGIYQPEGFPGPELGWFVVPEAEGKGVAYEAARAVMAWARTSFGWDRLCSIVDPGNARSIALGLRLGGVIDPSLPGVDPGDVVIRHDLRALA